MVQDGHVSPSLLPCHNIFLPPISIGLERYNTLGEGRREKYVSGSSLGGGGGLMSSRISLLSPKADGGEQYGDQGGIRFP